MSLPITAVGPLNVETNPILTEFAAIAGVASARAVAPASQNAVLIFRSLLTIYVYRQSNDPSVSPLWGDVFCARNRGLAASTNRRLPLRTFGSCSCLSGLHHNSHRPRMARIIVLVGRPGLSQSASFVGWVEPTGRANARPMMNSAIAIMGRQCCDGFGSAQPILR